MLLFFLSVLVTYPFIFIGLYILRQNKKSLITILAAIEYFSFAWWSFFYAFIYISPTSETAMIWHRIASIGWVAFIPVATHFFFILSISEKQPKHKKSIKYLLLYVIPLAIVINALLNPEGTSVTSGFMKTQYSFWVYKTNNDSIWYWAYIVNIIVYFSLCLSKFYSFAKSSGRKRVIKQATSVLLLNSFVLIVGMFLELILPVFYHNIPPVCHFVALFWGFGFLYIVKALKLTNPEDAATPDLILKTVADPILVLSKEGVIENCNEATGNLFKLDKNEIIGKELSEFYASGKYNMDRVKEIFAGKSLHGIEAELINSRNEKIFTTASFTLAETRLDGPVGIIASFHDVTALKKIQMELNNRNIRNMELSKQLEVLANYDTLTELPNRRLFKEKLSYAIIECQSMGNPLALFFIDLDGFKQINDKYGHDIGDKLLKKSAEIFKELVRDTDFIARIGGDEFVILFDDFNKTYLDKIVMRLKKAFNQPIEIDGLPCQVGISIGISKCPEDGSTEEDIMKTADSRMYEEKNRVRK